MKIDGMNFVNGFRVTNSINKRDSKKSNTSFKGHILTQDNRGDYVYKFFLPNAPENTKLHLAVMTKDKYGDYKVVQRIEDLDMPKGSEALTIRAKDYVFDNNSRLGYRFTVNGGDYTDDCARGDWDYNLTVPIGKANPHRSRLMQHVLVDSFNIPNPSEAKRNHFNLLGGDLKSVEAKVPVLAEYGVGEIIGNPIFGQGNKENHGYWTTNAHQITKNIGSYKDFKNLMITLYKHGMGWTADGAFVNEGWEGIHVKDIMNWGAQSPFVDMFESKDLDNNQVRLGVFSKNREVNKHIHIKLVNAPYKIVFEKTPDGYKEKEVKKVAFNPTQSTYIQLFDDRLVNDEQANDDEKFDFYALKEPDNRYAIASSRDSVQPLNFRVSPSEVEANFKKYKEVRRFDKHVDFKNFLTQWTHFNLVNSNKDGGLALWVGNSDIAKMRFVLSEYALNAMKLTPERQKEVEAAQYRVQDEKVQITEFWTNENARILVEYTAKALADKINDLKDSGMKDATKAELYETAVKELIQDKLLPKSAEAVYEKELVSKGKYAPSAMDNLLEVSKLTGNRRYKLKPTVMPENILDGLMAFPPEAVEFSPELTSVFAYPYFKNLAISEKTIGMSRYEMYKKGDEYYNKISKKYRETYKKTDKLYAEVLAPIASDIMKLLESKSDSKWFNGNELTTEGREMYSVLAPDIAKFIFVSALAPDVDFDSESDTLEYDLNKLRKYDLNKLNLQYEVTPEDVALTLLNKIKKGAQSIPSEKINKFVEFLHKRVEGIDSDAINVAKLIIDKTETGLDWRIDAAKDVGDWDSLFAGRFPKEKNNKEIIKFWNKVNTAVSKHNPNSYKIGEITDWDIDKSYFIEHSMFDTMTDYESFFSSLVSLYGQNDEGGFADNFYHKFAESFDKFYKTGTYDNINYAHRFVGNHDKPRILHLLATNVRAFNKDKSAEVHHVLSKGFEKSNEFKALNDEFKNSIKQGLDTLKSGFYTVNGVKQEFDSENFGIRPFDYSIADAVNEACYINPKFKEFADKNQDKIEKMKAEALEEILKPALNKYRAILMTMIAFPGTPTHYSGDEFGQTGWETNCKNEKQENRNAVRWDLLGDKNYDFIKKFYENDFKPLMKIRSLEAASALVNGATVKLNGQGLNGYDSNNDRGGAFAMYRYNDKTDAIAVLHGVGYGMSPDQAGKNASLDSIYLGGLKNGLAQGTIYVNALKPEEKYKVCDDGYHVIRINDKGEWGGEINLGTSGIILLREKGFNGKKFSFKGRIENANVKLANTKYNFAYMSK